MQKLVENRAFRLWNNQLRGFGMRELMSEIGRMEEEKQKMAGIKRIEKDKPCIEAPLRRPGKKSQCEF